MRVFRSKLHLSGFNPSYSDFEKIIFIVRNKQFSETTFLSFDRYDLHGVCTRRTVLSAFLYCRALCCDWRTNKKFRSPALKKLEVASVTLAVRKQRLSTILLYGRSRIENNACCGRPQKCKQQKIFDSKVDFGILS